MLVHITRGRFVPDNCFAGKEDDMEKKGVFGEVFDPRMASKCGGLVTSKLIYTLVYTRLAIVPYLRY